MSKKDDVRLGARLALESALSDYYKACQAADYEFASDVIDVIFDATEGNVILSEE